MTVQEMLVQIYDDIGAPTNYCPYTDPNDTTTFSLVAEGSVKLLSLLNQALIRISSWRFRDGSVLRLRGLFTSKIFGFGTPYTAAVSAATASGVTIPVITTGYNGMFDGWIIEMTSGLALGETFMIASSIVSGGSFVCSLIGSWTTIPLAGDTFKLYKNFSRFNSATALEDDSYHIALNPVTELADVIAVVDIESKIKLEKTMFDDLFVFGLPSKANPTSFRVYGNRIYFDNSLDELRYYNLIYVRQPVALTTATQIPDIPPQFHPVLCLWVAHIIFRTFQGFDKAYALKREVEDTMEQLRLQGHFDQEMSSGGLVVYT